jgi:hypothetical protein
MAALMSPYLNAKSQTYVGLGPILPRWMRVHSGCMAVAVTYSQIIAEMRRRADRLLADDLDDLVKDYGFPLPVDLLSTRVIVRSAAESRAMLALQRKVMLERGVTQLEPDVTAVDLPRAGRFRVWVDWHEISPGSEVGRLSSAVYFCSVQGGALRIQMIQYHRLSMPEMKPQFAALAMTA